MSRILRFFVCLGTLFFVGNAFAAGYSCPEYKKYTCCAAGYYMTKTATSTDYYGTPVVANACRPCSAHGENYTCPAGSDGCTGAPQAITIDVKCQPGEYLPQGKTSCETCTAGNYCEGVTVKGVSLVTGAEKDFGLSSCSSNTGMLYSNSAAGSSSINDCYLTLADDESVETVNRGTSYCQAGYYCGNGGRRIYYDADNEERDLTDSRPTIAPSTACARGSYSDDMATSCEVCPNGTTTSGTGSDYCDVTCSNSANVATWVTPEWTPNYVSNSCKVASCVACTKGTGVASCTASTDGNKCTYTATCSSGYKNPTCNGTSCSCTLDSVTCAAGQYLPKGATSCATCPKGYKCPSSSKTYTVSTTTDQGNMACSGSTEYQDTTGQTSCKTPSDGYYKKDNTSQQPCGTGYFCKSGVRTACTTYGTGYTTDTTTASVNTQCYLNVAGGKVRNGTTGTTLNTCAAGKYKAAHKAYYGTSYSCDSCPTVESGWTMGTDTGLTNYTSCYETKAATSVSSYCSAGQLKKNATSATAWGTATISTAFQAKGGSIVNGQTCTQCSSGTYSAGGTATSCSTCDSAYPYSDAGTSSAGSCYKNGTKTGSQLNGSVPTNCYSVTSWNSCTPGTCTYRIYKSGTTTSCTPTNCTKTPAAVTAKSGYRTNGTSCTACPNGYPNSADGNSGGITACYSNSKSRAWTGSQVNGSVPTNCNSVTSWNSCSVAACSYVAYSNSSGNGDGTIKSGCSTNSADCTKTPAAVTAKSGYRTNGTSCTACPNGYPNSADGNSGGAAACYMSVAGGKYVAKANESAASGTCAAGTYKAAHSVYYGSTSSCSVCATSTYSDAGAAACTACATANGYTNSGTTAASHAGVASCKTTCSGTQYVATAGTACVTVGTGYWGAGGTVSQNATLGRTQCPANYRNGAAASAESGCQTSCAAGTYVATAKAACTTVGTGYYRAAHSVNYGATSTRSQCPENYRSGAATGAESSCQTSCAAGTYVATAKAACTTVGTGYYRAAHSVNYGSTSTRTQCPAGYRDGAAAAAESACTMNVAGGKFVKVAKESAASGTCDAGYAKAAHSVTYGNTSACAACTGATYAASTGQASCTACPSIYTSNTDAAKSKIEQCQVKTTGGYYIKTAKDATQTECDGGYYCPSTTVAYGDTNSPNACPVPADHKRATIPAEYYASSIAGTSLNTWSKKWAAVTQCQVLNTYEGTRGSLYDYLTYNTTTQKYDVQGSVLWFKANPGYYLTTATGCGTYAYYGKAVECDKNAYCPGKDKVECNSSNQATVQVEKFGLELCSALGNGKYATSDGGAAANSTAACYLTTTGQNFVAAAGAAESACTAGGWCPGNVKVAYGSTGGRNTCPTTYPSSAASSNSNLDCYVTTAAGKYVATVGAGQVNCAGTGYYCPGGTNVYSGAYGSRLTTGGRTQCPAGYRDLVATVSTTKEAQCTMNVAGGKFVKVAKESAASGTCDAGYAKAAHSVTYGNTSACAACTGATYAASTGQASCTACPTAKTYASAVKSYGYWNNGKDGDHTISGGCYVTMSGTLSNGSLTWHGCYLGTDGDYGNGGGKRCYVHQDNLKCNAGYYASTLSNGYVWNNTRAGLLGDTCVGVGAGYYSAADVLTRSQCPTGLTTIGYGAGADEVTDCGRILHFGDDKLYLRSGKKTTPSLNVKIGDTTYYGNMTAGTGKGKLRLKSGSTTYSVHDDSM